MEDSYYYCLEHKTVEGGDGCKAADRLGPYQTRDEAERALEKVRQRNEDWDNDPAWNEN